MNKYLFYEYPIQVSPSLCEEIGVNEAIFLQQLHYRLLRTNQERNGRKWICITYGELQEDLRFFSLSTIKRIVKSLVNRKVISVENFNGMKMDNTNWYTINYEKLFSLMSRKNGGNTDGK